NLPSADGNLNTIDRRLMVAQDASLRRVGTTRADIYWGAGDAAGRIAGRIRQQGRFVILLPRELDMVAAGKAMPLPRAKPWIPRETFARNGQGDQSHGQPRDSVKPPRGKTWVDRALTSHAQKVGDPKKSPVQLRPQAQPAKSPLNKKRD